MSIKNPVGRPKKSDAKLRKNIMLSQKTIDKVNRIVEIDDKAKNFSIAIERSVDNYQLVKEKDLILKKNKEEWGK